MVMEQYVMNVHMVTIRQLKRGMLNYFPIEGNQDGTFLYPLTIVLKGEEHLL